MNLYASHYNKNSKYKAHPFFGLNDLPISIKRKSGEKTKPFHEEGF